MKINIDFGFAYLKALSENGNQVIFPSVSGEMQSGFGLTSSNGLGITTQDGSWLFGQSAMEQSVFASRSQDFSWFLSDEYKAGILTAISELTKASRVDIELMVALPYNAWNTISSVLISELQGEHSIQRNGRNRQLINIQFPQQFATFPQNFSPLFVHFLDKRGNPQLPETQRPIINIAIFNGGGNTIEYSTIKFDLENFKPVGIKDQSGTEEKGMFNLSSVVKSIILQEYDRKLDDHEAFQVIQTGQLEIQDKDIDVSELIGPAKKQYLHSLLNICNTTWIGSKIVSRDDLFAFIVSGGQGPVLLEFFREMDYHGNLMMSDNPQFDVVNGMARLRKMLGE